MVMKAQPEGMRRIKQDAPEGEKAASYSIELGPPVLPAWTRIGETRRVTNGSVSSWHGILDDEPQLPTEQKVHGEAMEVMKNRFLVLHPDAATAVSAPVPAAPAPAEPAPAPPEAAPKAAKPKAEQAAAPAKAKAPRKSAAQRRAEQAERDTAAREAEAGPTTGTPAPLTSPEPSAGSAPGAGEAEREPGLPDPAVQAEVEAAFQADEQAAKAAVEQSGAVETTELIVEVVEPDGEVAVEVVEVAAEVEVPATASLIPGGTSPFDDPLGDPLSPAFIPQ